MLTVYFYSIAISFILIFSRLTFFGMGYFTNDKIELIPFITYVLGVFIASLIVSIIPIFNLISGIRVILENDRLYELDDMMVKLQTRHGSYK